MQKDLDLVIVAEPSDCLAQHFFNFASSGGCKAHIYTLQDAARLYSVKVGSGAPEIHPDVALFLRLPPPPPIRRSFGAAFQQYEYTNTLWAASVLQTSPCVNRPTENGLAGRSSISAAITEMRSGATGNRREVFCRNLNGLGAHDWCAEDTVTLDRCVLPNLPLGVGPYRCRPIERHWAYELVLVLGQKVWRVTQAPLAHLRLEERSIAIVDKLDLIFAAVTWAIHPAYCSASLARVDPYPSVEQVGHFDSDIYQALLTCLCQ